MLQVLCLMILNGILQLQFTFQILNLKNIEFLKVHLTFNLWMLRHWSNSTCQDAMIHYVLP